MYFSFNFAWDSIQLGFVHYEQGAGAGLLNGQNPLSVTKVICRRSFKEKIAQTLIIEIKNELQSATWADYKHHKHS